METTVIDRPVRRSASRDFRPVVEIPLAWAVIDDARAISNRLPTRCPRGEFYAVSVRMENTGPGITLAQTLGDWRSR